MADCERCGYREEGLSLILLLVPRAFIVVKTWTLPQHRADGAWTPGLNTSCFPSFSKGGSRNVPSFLGLSQSLRDRDQLQ
jgi:hypothetical protein